MKKETSEFLHSFGFGVICAVSYFVSPAMPIFMIGTMLCYLGYFIENKFEAQKESNEPKKLMDEINLLVRAGGLNNQKTFSKIMEKMRRFEYLLDAKG